MGLFFLTKRAKHFLTKPKSVNMTSLNAKSNKSWSGLLFLAPFLILYVFILVLPFFNGLFLSLYKADLFGSREFVGLENYGRLFGDAIFLQSLRNTLYFLILSVVPLTIIPLILAIALNKNDILSAFFRAFFFAPSVMSVTIVTLIWRMVLMNDGGFVNNILAAFNLPPIPFLADPNLVMPSMAIITIWWCIGLPMTIYLAALQQIPGEIYEAASLDNSGHLRTAISITIPMVAKTIAFVAIVQCIMQFQLFGQPQLITQGGPNGASRPIVLFIFEVGFRRWDIGYAQAASQILTFFILGLTVLQYLLSRKSSNEVGVN